MQREIRMSKGDMHRSDDGSRVVGRCWGKGKR